MFTIRQFTNLLPQPVRFELRRRLFSGGTLTCPLCGNMVKAFHGHGGGASVLDTRMVVGGMRRESDRCPICHGCDRTRMMMMYLESETEIGRTPVRVLHIAPDFGLYLWIRRQPGVDYVCSDLDASRYRHIEGLRTADLTKLPFETDDFDIVICSHVLEHIPDDAAAMAEIKRVLRPGGRSLLLTPFAMDGGPTDEDPSVEDPAERESRFGQWDHVRIYSRDDFLARMEAAGLQTLLYEPFSEAPERAKDLRLNPLETLPIGIKPLPSA